MKPARIAVICVAAVSAIGLALVVRAMGSSSNAPVAPAAAAPVEQRAMTRILVAAKDIQPGKRLTDADMAWKDWPADEIDPSFIIDASAPSVPKDATPEKKVEGAVETVARVANEAAGKGLKSDYLGSVVRETILAGEPIVGRKIVRAGDSGYLAAYLEPGMRAMAIGVTVETAAGGFILPGDRVDVVLSRENEARGDNAPGPKFSVTTVMRNLKVLAIDQQTRAGDDAQAVVGATATLEVGPQDAEALALAKAEGDLSLVLRSYADNAGPSGLTGRIAAPAAAPRAVKVYRGGEPQVVTVQ
ncbi:Flp pilus assembly protein CpaB [uncultured Brevundimonas sp.]|uniref:Flp pilus assembly protein CpaB n=1 Tax=uncultured Brevundimonas sp. TaxID=213418 RepID=UPI0025F37356|nr:Flp pilus assembly protein CpaB [uncultured Brevundimonas sp.]